MAAPAYNDALFRQQVPAMADTTQWPEATMSMWYGVAQDFICISSCPCAMLNGNSAVLALNLMTAHIATLMAQDQANEQQSGIAGTPNGIETNATIGSVSVGQMQPPVDDMWDYWLAQTGYGQMLQALLKVKSVGGFYVGGLPERTGYRKVGGVFW
jgi:hypothetical protein